MQCLPKQLLYVLPVLGGTILTFLHLMFSVFLVLHKYFLLLMSKWSKRTFKKCEIYSQDDVKLVASEVKQFGQVPKHLVIILGTETLALKDVVHLVVWSLAAGIPFVSFHDYQGTLKKYTDQLNEVLDVCVGRKLVYRLKNGYKPTQNGFSNYQAPCISILDASDGKEQIVNIVRKLCTEAGKNLNDSQLPTQDELDQILIKESGLPEANLAIYLGPICCMYGFMPWHARITEFLPFPYSDNITVKDFLSVLRKYSKCEMRFGK